MKPVAVVTSVGERQRPTRPSAWRWAGGVVGGLLVVDGLGLMTEGFFSFGVTLPFALGAALMMICLRWRRVERWLALSERRQRLWRWGWALMALWLASVACFWILLARAGSEAHALAAAPAAIVVLGSGTPNGQPSPTLAARLEAALAQATRYPLAPVVVSGGMDFGEKTSEGQVMGNYLRARGLPAERIVQEEKSTSTEENLRFSQPLLAQRGVLADARVHLVTSDFHTLRAGWIARRAGYTHAVTVGAPTPLYVRYNAWLREYFAVLSGFVLREF